MSRPPGDRAAAAARGSDPRSRPPAAPACEHGGATMDLRGIDLAVLAPRAGVIDADVLDAWFEPAPGVLATVRARLPWLMRSSPPAQADLLSEAVGRARGLDPACVLPGAGSSDLLFRVLPTWLSAGDRVLLPRPTYGEYGHLLGDVLGCRLETLPLLRSEGYALDPVRLAEALERGPALAALVNPNSPTGTHLPRARLESALAAAPAGTRLWIDETYVDYVGADQSLECWAAARPGALVCKSMSKVYGLSGLRVAYLCGHPDTLAPLRRLTPPWNVGLLAGVAAAAALAEPAWYAARHAETHRLRERLAADLTACGLQVLPGRANFVLAHLPASAGGSAAFCAACRARGLYLRDTTGLGLPGAVRVAVKDAATQEVLVSIVRAVLDVGMGKAVGSDPH